MADFDPVKHPRNTRGEFAHTLGELAKGAKVHLPGGISVGKHSSGRFTVDAGQGNTSIHETHTEAADHALTVSARSTHPDSLGGARSHKDLPAALKANRARARRGAGKPKDVPNPTRLPTTSQSLSDAQELMNKADRLIMTPAERKRKRAADRRDKRAAKASELKPGMDKAVTSAQQELNRRGKGRLASRSADADHVRVPPGETPANQVPGEDWSQKFSGGWKRSGSQIIPLRRRVRGGRVNKSDMGDPIGTVDRTDRGWRATNRQGNVVGYFKSQEKAGLALYKPSALKSEDHKPVLPEAARAAAKAGPPASTELARKALADREAGKQADWPRRTDRGRWQNPDGKTYSSSSVAVQAMKKSVSGTAAKKREKAGPPVVPEADRAAAKTLTKRQHDERQLMHPSLQRPKYDKVRSEGGSHEDAMRAAHRVDRSETHNIAGHEVKVTNGSISLKGGRDAGSVAVGGKTYDLTIQGTNRANEHFQWQHQGKPVSKDESEALWNLHGHGAKNSVGSMTPEAAVQRLADAEHIRTNNLKMDYELHKLNRGGRTIRGHGTEGTRLNHLGELQKGDTVPTGQAGKRATVISNEGGKIKLTNPSGGVVRGNRNVSPGTQTFKHDSKRLAALTGIPPASKNASPDRRNDPAIREGLARAMRTKPEDLPAVTPSVLPGPANETLGERRDRLRSALQHAPDTHKPMIEGELQHIDAAINQPTARADKSTATQSSRGEVAKVARPNQLGERHVTVGGERVGHVKPLGNGFTAHGKNGERLSKDTFPSVDAAARHLAQRHKKTKTASAQRQLPSTARRKRDEAAAPRVSSGSGAKKVTVGEEHAGFVSKRGSQYVARRPDKSEISSGHATIRDAAAAVAAHHRRGQSARG